MRKQISVAQAIQSVRLCLDSFSKLTQSCDKGVLLPLQSLQHGGLPMSMTIMPNATCYTKYNTQILQDN